MRVLSTGFPTAVSDPDDTIDIEISDVTGANVIACGYDSSHWVTRINTTNKAKDAKTEVYGYDWLDRLRSASGGNLPSGLAYEYDAVGNAEKFAGKICAYGSYNKLTGDGTWSFGYDGNGNLAWKAKSTEKWSYEYNSLDQLVKVVKGTKSGQTWMWTTQGEYWYDANGARAKTIEGGVETHHVY
ncbi:MAG: hypothetical protein ACUVT7_08900, partial [Thermoplasmata archaeon]